MSNSKFLHPRFWPTWVGLGLFWLIVRLPHGARMRIGSAMGLAGYYLAASRRRIVQANLAACFPEMSEIERLQLARDTFRSGGMSLVETAIAWLGRGDSVLDIATVEGLEHIRSAQSPGRGVILMGTHMATLDLSGCAITPYITLDVMYRANKNELMEHIMTSGRERMYPSAIERGDIRQVIRNLKAGHIVWYGPDQDYGARNAVFVPFFGVPAATTTALSRIARMTGAPVVPYTHYREDNNSRYRVIFAAPLEGFPSDSVEDDARRINEFVEACIRRHPEQYWWFHRRFKTRPPGAQDIYQR